MNSTFYEFIKLDRLKPKLSDFLLDLHRSLAHQGFAKILDITTGMHPKGISCGAPAVFAKPYASRSRHNSSQKIAQLRFKQIIFVILINIFPHPILMQPNRICISFYVFINVYAIKSWRFFDTLLFPIDKNGHILFSSLFFAVFWAGVSLFFFLVIVV